MMYQKIRFKNNNEETKEILIANLFELGALGLEEKKDLLIAYFEVSDEVELKKRLNENFTVDDYKYESLESENWMENWKNNFKVIEIGDYFIVKPTWEKFKSDNKIVIIIEPKMAFGTGTHETTQLIMEELPKFIRNDKRILDLGTGSGILAIAAEKLGAKQVEAIDFDPIAIENANENIKLNFCKKTKTHIGEIASASKKYDVILANINRDVILKITKKLISKLKNNGFLILSGLLEIDINIVRQEYSDINFIRSETKNEWALLIFQN